jgi:hypothetical protein
MSSLGVKPRNRLVAKFSLPLKSVDWSELDVSITKSKFNRTTNLLIGALVLISSVCVLFGYIAVQLTIHLTLKFSRTKTTSSIKLVG